MSDPLNDDQLWLSAIVSSSEDAIVGNDLNGTIVSWNSGAERIFGYSAQEAIGQSIRLIIPPELYHEENDVLSKVRAGEGIDRSRSDSLPRRRAAFSLRSL